MPEAQLDRFLLNPVIKYLPEVDEVRMVGDTTGEDRPSPQPVLSGPEIEILQSLTRQVPASESVVSMRYAWSQLLAREHRGVIHGLPTGLSGVPDRGVPSFSLGG